MSNNKKRKTVILSGPVHSGNSAALMKWVDGKSVAGFITPTINHKKVLFHIQTGETSIYERNTAGENSVEAGKYHLSKESFTKAKAIVTNAIEQSNKQWLVVDEIGKLELKEEGHHALMVDLLANWKNSLLFVVRDYLLEQVIFKYKLTEAEVIDQHKLNNLA